MRKSDTELLKFVAPNGPTKVRQHDVSVLQISENEKFQTEPILKLKFNENRIFQNFLFSLNNENGT